MKHCLALLIFLVAYILVVAVGQFLIPHGIRFIDANVPGLLAFLLKIPLGAGSFFMTLFGLMGSYYLWWIKKPWNPMLKLIVWLERLLIVILNALVIVLILRAIVNPAATLSQYSDLIFYYIVYDLGVKSTAGLIGYFYLEDFYNKMKKTKPIVEQNNVNEKNMTDQKKLDGLGGWLMSVGLILCMSVFFRAGELYDYVVHFAVRTDFLEMHIPVLASAYKLVITIDVVFFVSLIYLIYLFFKKNKKFPQYCMTVFALAAVYSAVVYTLLTQSFIPSLEELQQATDMEVTRIGVQWVSAILLIVYLKKSKRVQVTFQR